MKPTYGTQATNVHMSQLVSYLLSRLKPSKTVVDGVPSLSASLKAKKPQQHRSSFLQRLGIVPPTPQ